MICALRNIHFSYPEQLPVLKGISADFVPGKVVAVCGDNGAGKSTLLNLIALDQVPDQGEIVLFGQTPTADQVPRLRRRIGLLPQNPFIFSGTVLDNMALGLRFHGTPRAKIKPQAMAFLSRFGIDAIAEEPATQLSGGQKQRLAFARMLVLRPQIVLLDEPFNHLDSDMTRCCADLLQNPDTYGIQWAVFTTHDSQALQYAHMVLRLAAGKATTETLR